MDQHIKEYYRQSDGSSDKGRFHQVISLNEKSELSWEKISKKCPVLQKGWYELMQLPSQDRIDFVRDFWLGKLPYHPKLEPFLNHFFGGLDDICLFIIQKKFDDPINADLVYSLKNNSGFFRGALPATEEEISKLNPLFPEFSIPTDYVAFLQIHNGFSKVSDCTGIIPTLQFETHYLEFQQMLENEGNITTVDEKPVDPKTLIPFYESFGMPFFQCFWTEWYPEQEMGNVYYSGITKTISDVRVKDSADSMAFSSFTDWLIFYMEQIE
jgi:SMI1/KNR4 family protein SUKH-1